MANVNKLSYEVNKELIKTMFYHLCLYGEHSLVIQFKSIANDSLMCRVIEQWACSKETNPQTLADKFIKRRKEYDERFR